MQTSCGRGLQPPPALALAFLQADVDARHCEVVCTLVWLNKVPARHAVSQGYPRPPQQPQTCQSLCKAGPRPPEVETWLAPISRSTWQSKAGTLKPGHTEHTEGPFPGRSILLGSTCALPLDILPKVHTGCSVSVPKASRTGWGNYGQGGTGISSPASHQQSQGSPGAGH